MYMTTYSGKVINLLSPKEDDFDIEDIALGLSNVCRFSGQVGSFYSVAEHSVNVSIIAKEITDARPVEGMDLSNGLDEAYNGLMHDASEAYLCDLITPVKRMMPDYMLIEDGFMKKLSSKYGFYHHEEHGLSDAVHLADKVALLVEAENLISRQHRQRIFDEVLSNDRIASAYNRFGTSISIHGLTPPEAREHFMKRWSKLIDLINMTDEQNIKGIV